MITYRELSRPLRLAVAAPWCLLLGLAGTAATPAFRQLLLDPATGQPTTTVSLSGPQWTGTLDPARLPSDPVADREIAPAAVNATSNVVTGGTFTTRTGGLVASDLGISVAGNQIVDGSGNVSAPESLSAPVADLTTIHFSDHSEIFVDYDQLTWTDQYGNAHVLATVP